VGFFLHFSVNCFSHCYQRQLQNTANVAFFPCQRGLPSLLFSWAGSDSPTMRLLFYTSILTALHTVFYKKLIFEKIIIFYIFLNYRDTTLPKH
jgi:hypothetical protein